MKKSMQAVILSLIVVAYYLFDSTLDFILQNKLSFIEMMITAIPQNEIFNRLLGIILISFASIMYMRKIKHPVIKSQQVPEDTPLAYLNNYSVLEMVSAQLRTTLNNVLGFLIMVKDKNTNQKTKDIFTEYVYSSSTSLLQLMNILVGLYQIKNKNISISESKVDVNQMLFSIDKKYNIELNHRIKSDIQLQLHIPQNDNKIIVSTDSSKLISIVESLIENAIDFSKQGTINYGYTIDAKNIKFFFYDRGTGISMEQLSEIFKEYTQNTVGVDISYYLSALRTEVAGKYAEIIGGKLWSTSQKGNGSSFYFTLPLYDQKKSNKNEQADETEILDWSNNKILIAEDVYANYFLLEAYLETTGIKIMWAKNGLEAVTLYKKYAEEIDLVLMDIMMPEMDGFEAAAQIKKQNKTSIIIGQTAYSLDSEQDIEKLKYFEDFLTKPIWDHELISVLNRHIK